MRPRADDWMHEAGEDLRAAKSMIAGEHYNTAMFMSRQAVEKALKGAHEVVHRLEAPYVHGLRQLARTTFEQLPEAIRDDIDRLDPLYTMTRYPNAITARPSEYYSEADATASLAAATEVLEWIKEKLRAMS